MTSETAPRDRGGAAPTSVFVWVWLPGATEPVVAGRLEALSPAAGTTYAFTYGRSYLERDNAVALYSPELPLRRGRRLPAAGMGVAGCLRDASPDAWGQRVILARHAAHASGRTRARLPPQADTSDLDLLTYLVDSDSDRIGALDFQESAEHYVPRTAARASLDQLQTAFALLESGQQLPPDLTEALQHGTSIGGARPKALVDPTDTDAPHDPRGRRLIAKFASSTDPYPVVKAEGIAMDLARRVGLEVAHAEVTHTDTGRDVLLVRRFDRTDVPGQRRLMVTTLTLQQLDEMMGRYATYSALADMIRARFTDPRATLRELFSRIVFNILVGNTDDHARNTSAFWDGGQLTLTPAYDLCPQLRAGTEASQAMAVGRDGSRSSQVLTCVDAAEVYQLSRAQARDIVDAQVGVITSQWTEAADAARLTAAERDALWGRQVLNPFAFHGYSAGPA